MKMNKKYLKNNLPMLILRIGNEPDALTLMKSRFYPTTGQLKGKVNHNIIHKHLQNGEHTCLSSKQLLPNFDKNNLA